MDQPGTERPRNDGDYFVESFVIIYNSQTKVPTDRPDRDYRAPDPSAGGINSKTPQDLQKDSVVLLGATHTYTRTYEVHLKSIRYGDQMN